MCRGLGREVHIRAVGNQVPPRRHYATPTFGSQLLWAPAPTQLRLAKDQLSRNLISLHANNALIRCPFFQDIFTTQYLTSTSRSRVRALIDFLHHVAELGAQFVF